jgi:hypothetical protein
MAFNFITQANISVHYNSSTHNVDVVGSSPEYVQFGPGPSVPPGTYATCGFDTISTDCPNFNSSNTQVFGIIVGYQNLNVGFSMPAIYYNTNFRGQPVSFRGIDAPDTITLPSTASCAFPQVIDAQAQCVITSRTEPPLPPTATFTAVNVYDGLDAILLTITSSSTYVDDWKFYRSTTGIGGTYNLIATIFPSGGTTTYYDDNVITGNTYCYKLTAENELYTTTSAIHCVTVATTVNAHCVINNVATITNHTVGDTTSRYELWRSTGLTGTYIRCGATLGGGTTVKDRIAVYNQQYYYNIRQVTPYWTLTGATTNYTGTISLTQSPVLSGVLYSGTSKVTLSWTDSNPYKQYYEIYKSINNASYTLIATISGVTTYDATGLTIDNDYKFKIRGRINCFSPTILYTPYSNIIDIIWAHPINPPTSIVMSITTCTGTTINWVNNNTHYVTGNTIQEYESGIWTDIGNALTGATTFRIKNLTPIITYQFRVQARSKFLQASSVSATTTTQNPAPFNLSVIVTDVYSLQAMVSWSINDPPFGTGIRADLRISGTTLWTPIATISHSAVTYTYNNLVFNTHYQARLVRIGSEYPSSLINFLTPNLPIDYCNLSTGYTKTDTTCGNNGTISINDTILVNYFDFTLRDYIGNTYPFSPLSGATYHIPAGYYKLSAIAKPAYQYYYGNDTCTTDFIPIKATNTSINNVNVILKTAQQSFLIAEGGGSNRYFAGFQDTSSGHTYHYYLIKDNGKLVFSASTTNKLGFVYNYIPSGCYYGIIVNTYNNCTYLIPDYCIECQSIFNLSGVKQVFISAYNNTGNFTWDDWATSDEDFYVQGIDKLTFVGTKIKRFYNTNPWYKLPTNEFTVYTCPFDKVRQGFMYTNTLSIGFAPSDYQRWVDLIDVLKFTNRYLVVFQDNNSQWWTFGYNNVGARVYNYQHAMEINSYEIVFKYYTTGMLTSLSEDYVNNYILK